MRAGTPGYLAPEQFAGRSTDARTDVFSFGVVLYELFTGKAVKGLIADATSKTEWAAPAFRLPASTPAGLDSVIARCVSAEPAERWSSMAELRLQLKKVSSRQSS
jgi:serine/threonine-protein kinase